jgi:hypothetical protein
MDVQTHGSTYFLYMLVAFIVFFQRFIWSSEGWAARLKGPSRDSKYFFTLLEMVPRREVRIRLMVASPSADLMALCTEDKKQ